MKKISLVFLSVLLLVIVVSPQILFAENSAPIFDVNPVNNYIPIKKDSLKPISSSPYYDDYSNKFALFLYAKQKYNSFSIYDPISTKVLYYTPNEQLNMGFGFHYKWLGIGIAMNFGFINHDDDIYGKTKRLDWQTNVYMNKAVFDFYFQYYENFYIDDPKNTFTGWTGGDKPYVRQDVASGTLGLSGLYVFNHKKFSYKAAFVQTAVQKKSSGSFLLGGKVFIQGVGADSSLFPANSDFDSLPQLQKHSAFYFGLISAYAYSFTIKKYFFISLSLSATVQAGKVYNELENKNLYVEWVPVIHLQPRIAIGYNKPKWYAGFSFVRDSHYEVSQKDNDLEFSFHSGNFRLYAGMRFNWFSTKK